MNNQEAAEMIRDDMKLHHDYLSGTYRKALNMAISALNARPEIVRCKECKYWHREIYNNIEYFNYSSCDLNHGGDGHNFYCADAERRASNDESGSN